MVDLGTLAGKAYSFGVAINDHGQIAGYCDDDVGDGDRSAPSSTPARPAAAARCGTWVALTTGEAGLGV